ncbi:MAG: hypothetical protein JSV29_08040, partial [Candidatus Bathyarchaeota archaeon]
LPPQIEQGLPACHTLTPVPSHLGHVALYENPTALNPSANITIREIKNKKTVLIKKTSTL